MKLVNIYNQFREIYLFLRNDKGELEVKTENGFFPYYYAPDTDGNYRSYKGEPLRKMIVSNPKDVASNRANNSYEADILFKRRYLIDRVEKIEKSPVKYAFIDIEVLSDELPNVQKASQPVSCISVYNSFTDKIESWYLGDYEEKGQSEFDMIFDFIAYMRKEKFDIWLSWNVKFDYNYLYNRVPDFAQQISIIDKSRYGDGDILYPAGISIVDYLAWFKKVTFSRERSYALDAICQKHLGEQAYQKIDFGKLSKDIVDKNRNDLRRMADLEAKFKLIPYFNEIRRLAKVEWEDMLWNSRVIDMLLLEEAKKQKVALPMKPDERRGTLTEKEEFAGAFREAFATGAFYDIGKYDLTSAYPFAIIDFCLDPANIVEQDHKGCNDIVTIEGTEFEQNKKALLPIVVNLLMTLKNDIKAKLSTLDLKTEEYEDTKRMYDAIKSVVNSAYGVMGNRFFRLYDKRVASATTFVVRSLLHYVKDKCERDGYKVIYVDTDSVFIQSTDNLTQYLNNAVQEWAKNTFNKDKVSIEFDYEGQYERLLILTKCRYVGYLNDGKGIKQEIKGVEAKRKDSTVFMKKFQKELIDKILNKQPKEEVFDWIREQVDKVKDQPLNEIAFPCKISKQPEEYKNVPIFLRALRNTPNYEKKVGDPYYYIFMQGKDETKKQLVMAFDEDNSTHIDRSVVDWEQMVNRNITMKLATIFEAMGWDISEVVYVKPKKTRKKKEAKSKKKVA
jgi:DNA polymerase elongation subunit (family B)